MSVGLIPPQDEPGWTGHPAQPGLEPSRTPQHTGWGSEQCFTPAPPDPRLPLPAVTCRHPHPLSCHWAPAARAPEGSQAGLPPCCLAKRPPHLSPHRPFDSWRPPRPVTSRCEPYGEQPSGHAWPDGGRAGIGQLRELASNDCSPLRKAGPSGAVAPGAHARPGPSGTLRAALCRRVTRPVPRVCQGKGSCC